MHDQQADLDELEHRMTLLRRALRTALGVRDSARAARLRGELRELEELWEEAARSGTSEPASDSSGPQSDDLLAVLPARERVHQVLTLLGVPAAPKLISSTHSAFFSGDLPTSRLASLRRDEERSFRSAPNSRPYYLVPALTADRLSAARALITVSTWPLERRIIGPLSPRVDYLAAAMKIADKVMSRRLSGPWDLEALEAGDRLLRSFAAGIPGALALGDSRHSLDPDRVARAAEHELAVHVEADQLERDAAAQRARRQLSEEDRLFGSRLTVLPGLSAQGD